MLYRHDASFHDQAATFAAEVLSSLADVQVPPACILDVARLPSGRLVALETNTTRPGALACTAVTPWRSFAQYSLRTTPRTTAGCGRPTRSWCNGPYCI